jgi:hypothetical protein
LPAAIPQPSFLVDPNHRKDNGRELYVKAKAKDDVNLDKKAMSKDKDATYVWNLMHTLGNWIAYVVCINDT